MECPYCHGELAKGTISGKRDPIFWAPEGKDVNLFTTWGGVERRGGFPVTENFGKAEAWYCQACNRLIVLNAK